MASPATGRRRFSLHVASVILLLTLGLTTGPASLAASQRVSPDLVCDGAWHVAPGQHSKQFSFLTAVAGVTP